MHQHRDLLTYINKTTAGCKPKRRSNDRRSIRPNNNWELRVPRSYFNPKPVLKTYEGLPHRVGALVWIIGCLKHTSKEMGGPNHGAAGSSTILEPASCSAYPTLFSGGDDSNQIKPNRVIRQERIRNSTYGINYYNTLSALHKR